ncbi:hypothetical protein [Nonomuraea turcica]|uniref:hypothetical protein n=1 Tax=Nonomuraea sp. G32 TaxID=3067274 RepID=UPI00273CB303|nr:hypothetical protein [Nonomuraea sp. G32]MDP4504000.1 hypothetical protein [Nonomuraea sp. G32]
MTENLTTTAAGGATRTLLICGIVAGPLHIVVVLLQLLTRDGFEHEHARDGAPTARQVGRFALTLVPLLPQNAAPDTNRP